MRETIGRFRVAEKLGEGGMGVVYRAVDDDLRRSVALKMLRSADDSTARERLLREARAAAGLTHPNICQIYEIGTDGSDLFVAMEFLEGEPLDLRVQRGALPLEEASGIVLEILGALEVIHGAGMVHRDVKPSNVFLTRHGVKVLDFGLVRTTGEREETRGLDLTNPGTAVGTPRYMAPEQWAGETAGPVSDLFAVGAIYYELLTGQPAFTGSSLVEIAQAVLHKEPPALAGGSAILAADRVIQRALAKRPADRYPDASAMARGVHEARNGSGASGTMAVRRTRRVTAIPFRMLRPDPETEFLAFSLPDAVGASLSGIEDLVVRSTVLAVSPGAPDLKILAREADVDAVLLGTIMRGGDRLRVGAQLVEAPAGTILWSQSFDVQLDDLFRLQDTLVHRIVESLAIRLSGHEEKRLSRDLPATARAYEYYLRANQQSLASGYRRPILLARDLYAACIEEDPGFAPAWARLGRTYRVIGKYGHGEAEDSYRLAREAFEQALALDPELSLAHNFYTYFQVEEPGGALPAMVRLLARGKKRSTDPNLFAGLVVACRFCGLLEASLAAHDRARRLDPGIRTSVQYTHSLLGNHDRVVETDNEEPAYLRCLVPAVQGRREESAELFRKMALRGFEGHHLQQHLGILAALEGDREECLRQLSGIERSGFRDPEGHFLVARIFALAGDRDPALKWARRAMEAGFLPGLDTDPWLLRFRDDSPYPELLARSRAAREVAAAAYREAGGESLLGVRAG